MNIPMHIWHRKKYIVNLPYECEFLEANIPTKTRPCQMNTESLKLCEISIFHKKKGPYVFDIKYIKIK